MNGGNGEVLWEVSDGVRRWTARRVEDPGWIWVVAYSGIPRSTGEAVRKVGARLAEPDGEDLLKEFERVALDGIRSVAKEDRSEVASLLDSNQELLRQVGVSHPRLEALLTAISLKNKKELDKDIKRIDDRHTSGELSDDGYKDIQEIVKKAQAGNWSGAEKLAYELRESKPYFK